MVLQPGVPVGCGGSLPPRQCAITSAAAIEEVAPRGHRQRWLPPLAAPRKRGLGAVPPTSPTGGAATATTQHRGAWALVAAASARLLSGRRRRRRTAVGSTEAEGSTVPHAAEKSKDTVASGRPRKRTRWISGLILGFGICGPTTFYGGWPFTILVSLTVLLITIEYTRLIDRILRPPLVLPLKYTLGFVCICTVLAAQIGILTGIFECASVTLLMMLLVLQGRLKPKEGRIPIQFAHISSQVFGVFYVGYLPAFWVRLRNINRALPAPPSPVLTWLTGLLHWQLEPTVGACATASCALCTIAADTCAYVGGKRWGKTPFTVISPKKTVEGAYFGLAGSIIMAVLCDWVWGFPALPGVAPLVGAMIFGASLLGDLTVSAIKRNARKKDAGGIIPGHGGILDRFDSYFFAAPVAYFCWYCYLMARRSPLTRLIAIP